MMRRAIEMRQILREYGVVRARISNRVGHGNYTDKKPKVNRTSNSTFCLLGN
jgi:hypothetical protein